MYPSVPSSRTMSSNATASTWPTAESGPLAKGSNGISENKFSQVFFKSDFRMLINHMLPTRFDEIEKPGINKNISLIII